MRSRQLINHSAAVCFDIPMHVYAHFCVASSTDHLLLPSPCSDQHATAAAASLPLSHFAACVASYRVVCVRVCVCLCVCVCAQFSCEKRAKFTRFSCKNCVNFTGFSHNAVFPCELSPGWSVCWSVGRLRRLTFLLKIKLLNTPCRKERTLRLKGKMLSAATKKQSN